MSGLLERIRRANRPPLYALGVNVARVAYLAGAEVLDVSRSALAAVAAIRARYEGLPLALQLLITPGTAADDLTGVAPACVVIAECDPLCDEGIAYADRLRAAGEPVQLDLVRGMTHDFIKMGRALKEAGSTQQFVAEALAAAWRSIP